MRYARFNSSQSALGWATLMLRAGMVLSGACASAPLHRAPTTGVETSQPAASLAQTPAPQRLVSPYTYEWFIRAELAASHGDLRGAVRGYERALAGADEDPLVLARLAVAADALGDHDRSQQALTRGAELDPRSEAIWLARGEIAARHRRDAEAHMAYDQAQQVAPRSLAPVLAQMALLRDAPERAAEVRAAFIRRNPEHGTDRARLQLQAALEAGELAQATAVYEELARLAAVPLHVREGLARLALRERRPWLARRVLGTPEAGVDDVGLWLDVMLQCHELDWAGWLVARATPEQLGGLSGLASAYLALRADEQAAQVASVLASARPGVMASSIKLRAARRDALAAEVGAHGQSGSTSRAQ